MRSGDYTQVVCISILFRIYFDLHSTVGSGVHNGEKDQAAEQDHLERLHNALMRLPRINLYVLDAIMSHLKKFVVFFDSTRFCLINLASLIDNTQVEEPNETYITKLALSLGRSES